MTITKTYLPRGKKPEGPRVNTEIRAPEIRLIDHEGAMIGVTSVAEGLKRALEAGLDLVEISPQASPPVCKVMDYGKYKYEVQKKKAATKKKQKILETKEVKVSATIEEHDYQVKRKSMEKFLTQGDRVKVTMRFRGREITHQAIGQKLFDRFRQDLDPLSKIEFGPKLEGRQLVMVMSPK